MAVLEHWIERECGTSMTGLQTVIPLRTLFGTYPKVAIHFAPRGEIAVEHVVDQRLAQNKRRLLAIIDIRR